MNERFSHMPTGQENKPLQEAEEVLMPEGVEDVTSHDTEAPASMQEYAAEQEKMADAQFELLREFQKEEEEALASVEVSNEKKEDGDKASRFKKFKKALLAITAGVMLFFSAPAFGGEQQKGEYKVDAQSFGLSSQIQNEQRVERQGGGSPWEAVREEAMKAYDAQAAKTLRIIQEKIPDQTMRLSAEAWVRSMGNRFRITEEIAHKVIGRAGMETPQNIDQLINDRRVELMNSIQIVQQNIAEKGDDFAHRELWDMPPDETPEDTLADDKMTEEIQWLHILHVNLKAYQQSIPQSEHIIKK